MKYCFVLLATLSISGISCKASQPEQANQTQSAEKLNQQQSGEATDQNQVGNVDRKPTVVSKKIEEFEQESSNRHSYNLKERTNEGVCETIQEFDDEKSYCEGLKNETLNKDCAKPQRKDLYVVECIADYGPFDS